METMVLIAAMLLVCSSMSQDTTLIEGPGERGEFSIHKSESLESERLFFINTALWACPGI